MKKPVKTGRNQAGQFVKGESGNPKGKPKGARHTATIAALSLLEGEASALTRKAVDLALEGDTVALRLCLERIAPPRRDSLIFGLDLPQVDSASDVPVYLSALLEAIQQSELTTGEAEKLARLAAEYGKAAELADIEERLIALEKTNKRGMV